MIIPLYYSICSDNKDYPNFRKISTKNTLIPMLYTIYPRVCRTMFSWLYYFILEIKKGREPLPLKMKQLTQKRLGR
jgi:hypothetical protein